MPSAFVIRPFGKKQHATARQRDQAGQESVTYRETDFEHIHDALIGPALETAGLSGYYTTGDVKDAGNIRADMFALILSADLVICDITMPNPNVYYELGVRHALRRKGTILLKGQPSADAAPFDLLTDRYLGYQIDAPQASCAELVAAIKATREGYREVDSPVFTLLPALDEAKRESVLAVPTEFREEVERAIASGSLGWLRLLAEDVRARTFESVGLRMIGLAQWKLRDYEAAQRNLEQVRDEYPDDVEASLALASIYERRARPTGDRVILTASEQAIDRALASPHITLDQRVEALTLRGRNKKTLWRAEFEGRPVVDARAAAANERLRNVYEAYRAAYIQDLNHFWSGLAAVQMGTLFLHLTAGADNAWKSAFGSDREAEVYRDAVDSDVGGMRATVRMAILAAMSSDRSTERSQLWAKLSEADLLFVTDAPDDRVRRRYLDLVPGNDPFVWDAVRGQLTLFQAIGFRAELAASIIAAVDAGQVTLPRRECVVLFAGHRIDAASGTASRFPAHRADELKLRIRDKLARLGTNGVLGLASAAPGADILFHECCAEAGIESIVCLPIPCDDYAGAYFGALDDWRNRFINLRSSGRPMLELCGKERLAHWLLDPPKTPPVDLWERGNRWVLNMALTSGARRVILLALWDEKDDRAPGGTAHMVRLARAAGRIEVDILSLADPQMPGGVGADSTALASHGSSAPPQASSPTIGGP